MAQHVFAFGHVGYWPHGPWVISYVRRGHVVSRKRQRRRSGAVTSSVAGQRLEGHDTFSTVRFRVIDGPFV
jgi:hypothetical protein